MIEPRSTATIRALASLAELSANQLEEGTSVEEVIATLRKAAEAVRSVIDEDAPKDLLDEEEVTGLIEDLTPMELSAEQTDGDDAEAFNEQKPEEEPVLNAG